MFCTNCGTQLPDDAKFCSNCGALTHGTPSGSGSSTQPERIYTGQTETAWIEAEKEWAGLGPGLLGHFIPGVSQPLDITLTVMASGPPGTGSVPVMSHGFRIWPTVVQPVEAYGSEQLGDGPAILNELTGDLIGYGFQHVDSGPFWFQRHFKREYIPGAIDYSDNTPLEERRQEEDRAYREEQRRLYRAGDIRYQKSMWIAYILFFFWGGLVGIDFI
jgi:zinc-ribbon domain